MTTINDLLRQQGAHVSAETEQTWRNTEPSLGLQFPCSSDTYRSHERKVRNKVFGRASRVIDRLVLLDLKELLDGLKEDCD